MPQSRNARIVSAYSAVSTVCLGFVAFDLFQGARLPDLPKFHGARSRPAALLAGQKVGERSGALQSH